MEGNFLENVWIDSKIIEDCIIGRVINVGKISGLNSAYEIWDEANNTILNCNENKEKLNQGFYLLKEPLM